MPRTPIVLAVLGAVSATVLTIVAVAVLADPARTPVDEPRDALSTTTPEPSAPSTPPATSTPTPFQPVTDHDWFTAVPEGFSVSAGLPEGGGDVERVEEPVTWTFCDEQAFPVGQTLDAMRDGATGPEYGDRRELRVFRDDRAAHAFLDAAAATAADCPEEQHGATRWIHSVTPVDDLGEETARLVQTYETDGMVNAGATWWDVVRVGNAVLVTATGGEYLPGETLGQGIREHERLLVPVVRSMCVFSAAGCRSDQAGAGAEVRGSAGG